MNRLITTFAFLSFSLVNQCVGSDAYTRWSTPTQSLTLSEEQQQVLDQVKNFVKEICHVRKTGNDVVITMKQDRGHEIVEALSRLNWMKTLTVRNECRVNLEWLEMLPLSAVDIQCNGVDVWPDFRKMSRLTDVTFFGSNRDASNFPAPEILSALTHISFSNFIHRESLDLWYLRGFRGLKKFAQMVSPSLAPGLAPNLTHLTLNDCSFIDWPDLKETSQITHLTINRCEFSKWPDPRKMSQLTDLVVFESKFPEWPNLGEMKSLTNLCIHCSNASPSSGSMVCGDQKSFRFPNIEGLLQLRELQIRGNDLNSMKIGKLPQLRALFVVGSELSAQIDFSTLPNITDLWVVTGDLFPEDIGSGIGSLMNLERLNVGGILFALPEKWEELKNLKMLDVANARVTQLPEWIGALTLNKLRLNRRLENSPSLRFVNQGTNVLFG